MMADGCQKSIVYKIYYNIANYVEKFRFIKYFSVSVDISVVMST